MFFSASSASCTVNPRSDKSISVSLVIVILFVLLDASWTSSSKLPNASYDTAIFTFGLITGFLGSGKTTFIKKYVKY